MATSTTAVNPNSPLPATPAAPLAFEIEEFIAELEALPLPERVRALRIIMAELNFGKRTRPLTPEKLEKMRVKAGFTTQQVSRLQRACREAFDFEREQGEIQAKN